MSRGSDRMLDGERDWEETERRGKDRRIKREKERRS
jgi:hypothetical protein